MRPLQAARINRGSTEETVAHRKLREAAQDFESILIASLWKAMRQGVAPAEDGGEDPGRSTLEDMGIEAMANALGAAGGLGIGQLILRKLSPLVEAQPPSPQPTTDKIGSIPPQPVRFKASGSPAALKTSGILPMLKGDESTAGENIRVLSLDHWINRPKATFVGERSDSCGLTLGFLHRAMSRRIA
jgi:Rod binding domain-containing protein